jgi:Flp pilus assembly protein TadD
MKTESSDRDARNELGTSLIAMGRVAEAEALYRALLAERPDDFVALNNLGNALAAQLRVKEAEALFTQALRLKPDLADTHTARGMVRLMSGRLKEGFEDYEWRWRTRHMARSIRAWPVAR